MNQISQLHSSLKNKNILVGITGSIAAYKSADLVRKLREVGATVRVAMTENAKRFITPLTMQAVSGFPVHDDLFDLQAEAAMGHIELARWADLILIAPASADFLVRLLRGQANDLLSTICLAAKSQIVLAPAMNQVMWKNTITQENCRQLKEKGIEILGPGSGSQACGDVGPGRMLEPVEIVNEIKHFFENNLLAGLRVLLTAGPTHEQIDPVRFITNHSSGKMGYALALAAQEAGADVTLISGPVSIEKPNKVQVEFVGSAQEMHAAVMKQIQAYDIFIGVAAVSDYRCEEIASQKIHKKDETLTLKLVRNPDIITEVARVEKKPFIVGFAAETDQVIEQGKKKKAQKKLDMIIINDVSERKGMGQEENEVTVIYGNQEVFFPLATKTKLARALIELIAQVYQSKRKDI